MLEVCHTHIAISDNLKAMGLKEQKTVNAIRRQNKPHQGRKPPADSAHSCGRCTKSHPPGRSSCPARDDHCRGCGKLGHWKPKCRSGQKGPKDKGPKHLNRGGKQRKVNEVGTDEDPHYDELVLGQSSYPMFRLTQQPKPLQLSRCQLRLDQTNLRLSSARLTLAQVVMSCHCVHSPSCSPGVLMPMVHQED